MHWVERGPEPEQLARIHTRYTPRWVRFYGSGTGKKPSDTKWREFSGDLAEVFHDLCAYCEELCRGEVDHFRPKSRYPELVYSWSNWLFACHDCNHAKLDKWPPGGYVDPCARSRTAHPERFFTYDTLTGPIIGAILLVVMWEIMRDVSPYAHMLLFATLVIVVMKFLRAGIYGLIAQRLKAKGLISRAPPFTVE